MKIITMIFLMFLAVVPSKVAIDDFSNQVHNAYDSYTILYGIDEEEQSNNYFHIKVIQGINNGEVTYGVVLYNEVAKSHELVVNTNGKDYYPKPNSRGDYLVVSISLTKDSVIHVMDNAKNSRKAIEVKYMTPDEFRNSDETLITGLGNGISISNLSASKGLNLITLLTIIFGGICILFGSVLLYMVIAKKGMFNKDKRVEGVLNFRELVESLQEDSNQFNENEDNIFIRNSEVQSQEETPIVNLYPQIREYDDDDEEIDVTAMVKNKGFNTDYPNLAEAEKNDIMLYLMQLRDFKDISSEAYQKEVIKLWKK